MNRPTAWGYHLIIDAYDCAREAITNPDILRDFSAALVEEIKMVPYGDPQIVHFGHNEPHLTGWTVIQLIETSNIICHFNDHTGEGYIDVFSCKEFDTDVAIGVIKQYFNPAKIDSTLLIRGQNAQEH